MATDKPGRKQRTIDTAERDADAARLRAQGKTYQTIAETLGWTHASAARKAVQRALVAVVQEAGDELRVLEVERLNDLLDRAYQVMDTVHYAHSAGKLIERYDAEQGRFEPLRDSAPILGAMDRVLKIMERRAKLLGLDAPTRHEVLTLEGIDAEIARLEREQAAVASRTETPEAATAEGTPSRS